MAFEAQEQSSDGVLAPPRARLFAWMIDLRRGGVPQLSFPDMEQPALS